MPKLYLFRHGQTDFNVKGIVQGGGVDSDLNSVGREQGRRFFEKYKAEDFDKVYCSTLKRTYQTVECFEGIGYEVIALRGLDELSWGLLEGKERSTEVGRKFACIQRLWKSGKLDAKVEGGESPNEVWERVRESLDRIISEVGPEGKALVCTHGRTMRVILSQMMGYGLQKMHLFPHENTILNVLINHPAKEEWILEKFNDLSHLQ